MKNGAIMNSIFKRVSVRKFDGKAIEDDKIESLLHAGMAAPSGGNQQPWQFVVVTDAATNEQLGETSKFSKPAAAAPLNIVPVIDRSNARFPELAQLDLSACVENILLEATELGLGGVWLCVYPEQDRMQHVRATLGIPDELEPFAIVSIGYPAEEPHPQQERFDKARIHRNRW